MKKHFFYSSFFFILFAVQAFAQTPAPTPGKEKAATSANEENSDVVIQ